jgi:hypothetical protein
MGILDDAIRQHLDLKRQRGATESELKELEDEAFGPPTRPGEPDFPGEDSHDQNGNGSGAETVVSEPEATLDDGPVEPSSEAEQSAGEHPVVESPPEAHEPPALEDEPQAAETPASEELTTVYDHTADGEPEVEEAVEVEEAEPDSAPPIESLDTVEHTLPEEAVEPESPPEEEPAPDPEGEAVPAVDEQDHPPSEEEPHLDQEADKDEADEDEGDEEDEDVLADTPEFLKDAPEDDELWFEQGEPKDFDF